MDLFGIPAGDTTVEFIDPAGQANVRGKLDQVLGLGTDSLRAAVCFFTAPGLDVLKHHATRLTSAQSFFVASIDHPTDLDALLDLHYRAPGHVYIHLGGVTPLDPRSGWRPLMHSKLFLSVAGDEANLWVGSHNLTGHAVTGVNFEAALRFRGPASLKAFHDAAAHLERCRITAELFDPDQMERYRRIQGQRRGIGSADPVLVIHAETDNAAVTAPFLCYTLLRMDRLEGEFPIERPVHLYLYPPGSLKRGVEISVKPAAAFEGLVTGSNRTAQSRLQPGLTADLPTAKYHLDIGNPPVFGAAALNVKVPPGQAILRLEGPLVAPTVYSLSDAPLLGPPRLTPGPPTFLPADTELARHYRKSEREGSHLIYRAAVGVQRALTPVVYPELIQRDARLEVGDSAEDIPFEPSTTEVYTEWAPWVFVARRHVSQTG